MAFTVHGTDYSFSELWEQFVQLIDMSFIDSQRKHTCRSRWKSNVHISRDSTLRLGGRYLRS